MPLKSASNKLESLCHIQDLYVFEHSIGNRREIIPIITEYSGATLDFGKEGQYEFFRVRGATRASNNSAFHPWHNQVSVTICHLTQKIRIGPTGQLVMRTKGVGLGPSLMGHVLSWLELKNISGYQIDPGQLSSVDAATAAAREQRNRFYMAFGFELSNYDGTQTGLDVVEGSFTAKNVGALSVPDRYKNRLRPWFEFAPHLKDERETGVRSLASLKKIDRWTYQLSCLSKKFLSLMGWPEPFETRHMHKKKPWEPD
ncbi:hypothetical protein [Pseudomonas sp. EpS/L25]|uniref:hypothetical protein n=1 Tax=Pseudomonas sp. EpS/L25 TaxID=1749078 RepID=UPI000A40D126|nr:hypothetical protein [Pseudomonas sp. EpS/L25]